LKLHQEQINNDNQMRNRNMNYFFSLVGVVATLADLCSTLLLLLQLALMSFTIFVACLLFGQLVCHGFYHDAAASVAETEEV